MGNSKSKNKKQPEVAANYGANATDSQEIAFAKTLGGRAMFHSRYMLGKNVLGEGAFGTVVTCRLRAPIPETKSDATTALQEVAAMGKKAAKAKAAQDKRVAVAAAKAKADDPDGFYGKLGELRPNVKTDTTYAVATHSIKN